MRRSRHTSTSTVAPHPDPLPTAMKLRRGEGRNVQSSQSTAFVDGVAFGFETAVPPPVSADGHPVTSLNAALTIEALSAAQVDFDDAARAIGAQPDDATRMID